MLVLTTAHKGKPIDFVDQYIDALIHGELGGPKKLMSSLIESHLEHALVSGNRKKKERVRDMDCDGVEEYIDSIENSCHGHRWDVLKSVSKTFEELNNNYTKVNMTLTRMNKTLSGDVWGSEGLYGLIALQRAMLYGLPIKNGSTVQNFQGFSKQIDILRRKSAILFNASVGVMDTEWTNLLSVMSRLGMFFKEFQIEQFMDQISQGSAEAEITQNNMMREINRNKSILLFKLYGD